jgi:hypothetical protein
MTALAAFGFLAATIIFCALVQLMLRFDGWLREHGFGFVMTGDHEYSVWSARLVQVAALAIGIFGFVKILID